MVLLLGELSSVMPICGVDSDIPLLPDRGDHFPGHQPTEDVRAPVTDVVMVDEHVVGQLVAEINERTMMSLTGLLHVGAELRLDLEGVQGTTRTGQGES